MRTSLLLGLTATLLLALVTLPAAAQEEDDYPPTGPTCALSDAVVPPGETVVVECLNWAPNTEVTATLFSTPVVLGTTFTDAAGRLTEGLTIPANTAPGPHTLRMQSLNPGGEPTTVDLAITVAAPAAAPGVTTPPVGVAQPPAALPTPRLPRTGSEALIALAVALGLLGAGGAALGVARRRNRAEIGA